MKKIFVLCLNLFLLVAVATAQEAQKSELHQQAESAFSNSHPITARYTFVRAYEDYFNKGKFQQGLECVAKAASLHISENEYKEAFDLLTNADQAINGKPQLSDSQKDGLHYQVSKERMNIYMRLRRPQSVLEHINQMERYAERSGNEELKNDALYNKAIYYYTFGDNAKGNAVFKEMANKLTASKEYDKVDKVYQTLIDNSRRSNNASLLAQSYKSYIAWKDSANALKVADEINALKKQISDSEAAIEEKDSSLTARQVLIVGLFVVLAALAAALIIGAVVLLRFVVLSRKQKKMIQMANENNALKAKFISNISAQLEPTLKKIDGTKPEVKALLDFSKHIQTLSELENNMDEVVELEEVQIQQFCEEVTSDINNLLKKDVTLKVNAPKMSAQLNRNYTAHILKHLLHNAAIYTPEGGTIWLDYKKRGAHTHQFLVGDTGCGIPEEKRDDIFKPFLEIHDLTKGDGLGLPTCKQMAVKMNGDLTIDPEFTKGTRFVLELHG